jgi:hypothetical protein
MSEQETEKKLYDETETKQESSQEVSKEEKVENKQEDKAETKVEVKAPEKYDLKLPEGSLLDASELSAVEAYAKSKKLTQEMAQDLVEYRSSVKAEHNEALQLKAQEMREVWLNDLMNDKEIGGDKAKAAVGDAKSLIDKFGNSQFKQALNDTGLGNHPELVRFLSNVYRSYAASDTAVHGGTHTVQKPSLEDVFYKNNKE